MKLLQMVGEMNPILMQRSSELTKANAWHTRTTPGFAFLISAMIVDSDRKIVLWPTPWTITEATLMIQQGHAKASPKFGILCNPIIDEEKTATSATMRTMSAVAAGMKWVGMAIS